MTDYIKREAATAYAPLPKHLREYQTMNLDDAWEDGYDFAIRQLNSIPAADVRPVVRGRWKKSYADNEAFGVRPFFRYCSECHEATVYPYNYCPNCGAKMEVQDG